MRALALLLLFVQEGDLEKVVPGILEKDKIPGAVIVAGTKDKITFRKAFGTSKLETVFDMASCTKVMATTTAAMLLVEEGKIGLDDPVSRYLPVFEGKEITVRELLTHRSGLPAYLTPKSKTPDEILKEIAAQKADKTYRYS